MYLVNDPKAVRRKTRKSVRQIIQELEFTLKHRKREILEFEYTVEADVTTFQGEVMMQMASTGYRTVTFRMRVLDTSVKRTLPRGAG